MSSHPVVERSEDTPIYLRLPVIAPLGSSVGIIFLVLVGACFYVRREEKRYKAAVPGETDPCLSRAHVSFFEFSTFYTSLTSYVEKNSHRTRLYKSLL